MKRGILIGAITILLILSGIYMKRVLDKATPVDAKQSLQGVSVVLDAGHGGLDNGASAGGLNEDDLNLKICFALKEELESHGAKVYMTRNDDQDMTKRNHHYSKQDDMYLRVIQIDKFNADYLISIHLNASPSARAWGSQVFYYNNSSYGKILANDIHESMKQVTGSRKKISGADFRVLRATKTVGVLIECGFISNGNERGQLSSSVHHQKLATHIVDGLENFHETNGKQMIKDKNKEEKKKQKEKEKDEKLLE